MATVIAVLFAFDVQAQENDEEAAREQEMFGAPPEPAQTTPGDAIDERERALFGGVETSSAAASARPRRVRDPDTQIQDRPAGPGLVDRLREKLDAREDVLSLGGRLFLQTLVTGLLEQSFDDYAFTAPSFLEIYLDARPSDRLRVFAQGRIQTDFAFSEDGLPGLGSVNLFSFGITDTSAILDQLWLKFDLARRVFITLGQQRLRWGSGRFYNPTDFLNPQRVNPVALLDQRVGIGLLKVHVPLEAQGINLYGILDFEDVASVSDLGGALRAEIARGQTEVAVTVAFEDELGFRGGVDVSSALWRLDVRSEIAVTVGDETPFFEGNFSTQPLEFPDAVDRSNRAFVQALVGVEFPFKTDSTGGLLVIGAEYFFNQAGYSDKSLYPFLLVGSAFGTALGGASEVAAQAGFENVLPAPPEALPTGFPQFQVSRHYVGAYASWISPGSWDDTTISTALLADLDGEESSGTVTLTVGQSILTFLGIQAFVNLTFGGRGAFKPLLNDDRFQVIDPSGLGPIPDLVALLNADFGLLFTELRGFEPLVSAGVALTLDF
ncbi:MAG: hypothetical protein ACFB9M_04510 [Myxococcota bacterium]